MSQVPAASIAFAPQDPALAHASDRLTDAPTCEAYFFPSTSDFLLATRAGSLRAFSMSQSWLGHEESDFRPAQVWFGWTPESLVVSAEIIDDDVFNHCTGFNESAFLHGDVLEIFIHPANHCTYYEIHASPGGALFQIELPIGWRAAGLRTPGTKIPAPRCTVETSLTDKGWNALLGIPFTLLKSYPLAGDIWRISVSRYDYTRGREKPVLSSISSLPRSDFHLVHCYHQIRFHPAGHPVPAARPEPPLAAY